MSSTDDNGSTIYYIPSNDPSAASTISSSASDAPDKAYAVNASVAGGILGGLAGLAILGFVISFFLVRSCKLVFHFSC